MAKTAESQKAHKLVCGRAKVDLTFSEQLALYGGSPVRERHLPYGRQHITEEDIDAVVQVLRSDWLTTGPKVSQFEADFAKAVGVTEAVAVSSGTAALHAAIYALGIGPGDEVIAPTLTFVATANCVVYQGATPIFADVDPGTLLIDPNKVEEKISPRTKAIICMDYAGQPCEYDTLQEIADRHGLMLIEDACHALGGEYKRRRVGSLTSLTAFSFHPVKHIATGEGGMVTSNDQKLAERMRTFRNHGITSDHRQRESNGTWSYEMLDLGYNYRLTDLQSALGISQLRKLPGRIARRQEIARRYDTAFAKIPEIRPLTVRSEVSHAYHLYVVRLELSRLRVTRAEVFRALRAEGIGVNVHYRPVHLHPFYRKRFSTGEGVCPIAEAAYEGMLSLPIFSSMTEEDINDVVRAVEKVIDAYREDKR